MVVLEDILEEIGQEMRPVLGKGKVASYIPALARVHPKKFGMAVTTLDGITYSWGDAAQPFSIQSVSKLFTLAMAANHVGEFLWERVGREPSGDPFNSLLQLEECKGIPRNPFINAGALVVSDVVTSYGGERPVEAILEFLRRLAENDDIQVNKEVAKSEREHGYRNRALANFIRSFANLDNEPEAVLETYFHQCAIEMSCADLSRAALFLAGGGTDPISGEKVVTEEQARRLNAIMLTCGHYDASGDFAFKVGLPGKSGVGGGIVAVVPGRASVAVWSPPLNDQGNSYAGTIALEKFARKTGWSIFNPSGWE